MTREKKLIYQDCEKAMRLPLGIHMIGDSLGGLLTVYTASVLGQFADAVFALDFSIGMANLWRLLLCIAVTVLVLPAISLTGNIFMLKYSLVHDRMILARFLDKRYASVMKYEVGDIQQRLDWDPTELRFFWIVIWENVVMIPVTFLYLMYSTLRLSVIFTLIVFACSLLKLIVPIAVKKLEQRYDMQIQEYASEVREYETEITKKPAVIRLYGLKDAFIKEFDRLFGHYFENVQKKSIRCKQLAGGISSFLDSLATLLILFAGAALVAKGMITPGTVAAMVGYFAVFHTLIEKAQENIKQIPLLRNRVERLLLFYEEPERMDGEEIDTFSAIDGEGLAFDYAERNIFKNLNFHVRMGEKVAICGPNGSGKSTLIKVMCGLLDGYRGSLRMNGREQTKVSVKGLRKLMAYASQDPHLFAGSVKDNIWLGRLDASEEEVNQVMERMGISYLADRSVSMEQNDLSGGEKQKISIARALLKDTPVLLLDEPGNNLDAATIEWLKQFIHDSKKTILYISHDDVLTAVADRVVRMGT